MEEPGVYYRRFLFDVKAIEAPYLSDRYMQEYRAVLGRAALSDFAKLPLLALPLNPDYIQVL